MTVLQHAKNHTKKGSGANGGILSPCKRPIRLIPANSFLDCTLTFESATPGLDRSILGQQLQVWRFKSRRGKDRFLQKIPNLDLLLWKFADCKEMERAAHFCRKVGVVARARAAVTAHVRSNYSAGGLHACGSCSERHSADKHGQSPLLSENLSFSFSNLDSFVYSYSKTASLHACSHGRVDDSTSIASPLF